MHRRQEMEDRLNAFFEKCDRAVIHIEKLKEQAQGFVEQLNCDYSELKEKFLSCLKQLDEYNYLITDFNLAIENLDCTDNSCIPIHDVMIKPLKPSLPMTNGNLMDALSEPTPSTSRVCSNYCPPEKPVKKKIPKKDQLLISFSSSSCSSESVSNSKIEKEVQRNLENDMQKLTVKAVTPVNEHNPVIEHNLPAQRVLQENCVYLATITHVDGLSFWVVAEDFESAHSLMVQMNEFYSENTLELSLDTMMSLTYCAFYDIESDCYYRAFFVKITEEDMSVVEVYLVDTGETRRTSTATIQLLAPRFCNKPPYARCCHLAGIEILSDRHKEHDAFMNDFINTSCKIKIEDNSSESIGAYVVSLTGESLNDVLVQRGLARRIDKTPTDNAPAARGLPELDEQSLDIANCPEHDDPLVAVTGYHNRDEMDICKNYKGGPEKTCFKGERCKKRHVLMHPQGWTLDRVPVAARCSPAPLPAPGAEHRVFVTHVAHFNRFYVHLVDAAPEKDPIPDFGVVLPPTTLNALVRDMNSPATRMMSKPLKMVPAPGELVAALYPPDEQWYRARVISSTRADQNVEVMYIDYGNVAWVREDAVRELTPRHWPLPAQALRCALAGVAARSADSRQWAAARLALAKRVHERVLRAQVVSREYDEVTVELFDDQGYNVAETLAAMDLVKLEPYEVIHDQHLQHKVVLG